MFKISQMHVQIISKAPESYENIMLKCNKQAEGV